ncbi:MAG: type I-U CRISPR-associated protein Csb2 [Acidobacteriota bacterium]|nr:type I-U CRISPR-associated protein Csb2 [Acidobacteriota bacterium]
MPGSLLIAVRFLDGRYHGREDRFDGADGWPPSPGRLFQALVAGAARGANLHPDDGRALKWLECLDPPRIAAPPARRGRAVRLFVPNNDLDAVGGDPARVSEIRVPKSWPPCYFDADDPVLYLWDFESGSTEATHICDVATRLCQLGKGVDMAWANGQVLDRDAAEGLLASHPGAVRTPAGAGETAAPHPGTLDSLVDRHRRKRERLRTVSADRGKSRQLFTQPPKASFRHVGYDTPPRRLHFELRGLEDGFAPRPLAAAAPLLTGLRDAAVRRLQESLPAKAAMFERLVIGRGAGARDVARRVRLVPIPSIGAQHTDPSIRRIMAEIPADCPVRVDDLKWAFTGLHPYDPQTGEVWPGSTVSTDDARMADRFAEPAAVFRSMTPVALADAQRRRIGAAGDKTAKERDGEERRAAGAVVQALRHAGIRARPTDIRAQREPFQRRGVRVEPFAAGSRFSKHALWHVELRFGEPIQGPVIIGDGRFCGLGLMEPITHHDDVVVFELDTRTRMAPENRPVLLRHLRRALMALARDGDGRLGRLFSGHESDGRRDISGHHAHVFLAADSAADEDSIARLIVAAPWAVDRRAGPRGGEGRRFAGVARRLTALNAGRLGRFENLAAKPICDGDPLLGPATTWVSRTPYLATRNFRRRDDPASTIEMDVRAECRRRGLPAPIEVGVADVDAGPRGGRPTARLEVRFAVAVRGPLLLGRDSHAGGGMFHAR